ncbi:tetratricopeptide repeat protein [Pectobacterium sp. A535-S3-A17]|uniref:tetratricopeptide repeat protein n=2 Tax=Pectobacterium TaxID=122277 RepID=UPI001877039C|nr:tetratricopeptide repeat protein [Pectobacterium quasiaquaticum]MBE5215502.1 tetratricopeptide repeat protein [Pectobacterium quasiaquaticum]MBE5226884.1 tetratricopeptide repeat protein [Pectobacterium quasiaquaticum]
MGFISKLFNLLTSQTTTEKTITPLNLQALKASNITPNPEKQNGNISFDNDWITIDSPYFFGQAYQSANSHWVVGCSDSDGNGRGGHRESGFGTVILVNKPSVRIHHKLRSIARPFNAAVADTGDYIVHDAGFGSALQSDLIAIDAEGNEKFRRHYEANIYNIGLSQCGRYASVQTAGAPGNDGNILEVINLQSKTTMFSVKPEYGWADSYSFDLDESGVLRSLKVKCKDIGHFRYSATGISIDAEAYKDACLNKGDFTLKIGAARELLKNSPNEENALQALKTIDMALNEGAKDQNYWAATAFRIKGEANDLLGNFSDALDAYEKALSFNPKIGVQRRANALRKKIQ